MNKFILIILTFTAQIKCADQYNTRLYTLGCLIKESIENPTTENRKLILSESKKILRDRNPECLNADNTIKNRRIIIRNLIVDAILEHKVQTGLIERNDVPGRKLKMLTDQR